jgi:glycosyltransferase involved in cell wall biosynthesis
MMLGRPVITKAGTLAGDLAAGEGIGLAVPYGDVERLAEALAYLAARPREREEMGKRARALYERRYSLAEQCRRLREAYGSIGAEVR